MRAVAVKGIGEPVVTYAVLGGREEKARMKHLTPALAPERRGSLTAEREP